MEEDDLLEIVLEMTAGPSGNRVAGLSRKQTLTQEDYEVMFRELYTISREDDGAGYVSSQRLNFSIHVVAWLLRRTEAPEWFMNECDMVYHHGSQYKDRKFMVDRTWTSPRISFKIDYDIPKCAIIYLDQGTDRLKLASKVIELLRKGYINIVLDCQFADLGDIGLIQSAQRAVLENGGKLVLFGPTASTLLEHLSKAGNPSIRIVEDWTELQRHLGLIDK